jgi:multiple antibiotic resistance protein
MIWSDLVQLTIAILLIIGALLPVVNPLGDAPIFLRMTPGCDEITRAFLAKRIAFYSFFLVLGSLLLGSFVLRMFGLSIAVVEAPGRHSQTGRCDAGSGPRQAHRAGSGFFPADLADDD